METQRTSSDFTLVLPPRESWLKPCPLCKGNRLIMCPAENCIAGYVHQDEQTRTAVECGLEPLREWDQ